MVFVLVLLHIYEDVCPFLRRGGILLFEVALQDFCLLYLVYDKCWCQVLLSGRVFSDSHVALVQIHEVVMQFVAFDLFKRCCELTRVERGIFEVVCLVELLSSLKIDFVVNSSC